jgi:hypothetical protein
MIPKLNQPFRVSFKKFPHISHVGRVLAIQHEAPEKIVYKIEIIGTLTIDDDQYEFRETGDVKYVPESWFDFPNSHITGRSVTPLPEHFTIEQYIATSQVAVRLLNQLQTQQS